MSEEEIINVDASKMAELNQKTRLHKSTIFGDMEFLGKNSPIAEIMKSHNSFNLSAEGAPFTTKKDFGIVSGNLTTIETSKTSSIEKTTTVRGVSFVGSKTNASTVQVNVTGSAIALFIGCTFVRAESGNGTSMVVVGADAQAIFIGCSFLQGTYPVLNNATQPDCILIGCFKVGDSGSFTDPSANVATLIGNL